MFLKVKFKISIATKFHACAATEGSISVGNSGLLFTCLGISVGISHLVASANHWLIFFFVILNLFDLLGCVFSDHIFFLCRTLDFV